MDTPDYIVDIAGLEGGRVRACGTSRGGGLRGRPWLAIRWKCCGTYSRVYRNARATAYEGRCPRCGKPVRVQVGPGGTSNRFFDAM